ncbi:MAG: hypothetical protein ACSLFO_08215 [Acidimicrobiales bacterium]
MSDDKTPLEAAVDQAMDAFVFAPIGLVLDGPALFPTLVEKGRIQVQVARMMGKMAVQMGQSEAEKRVAATEGPLRDVLVAMGVAAPTPPPQAQPEPTVAATPSSRSSAVPDLAPAPGAGDATSGSKTAATKRTTKKRTTKKRAATKRATKKRTTARTTKKTAAKKGTRKAATTTKRAPAASSLSIPDYDSLSASQVVKRLRGMPSADLDAINAYEAATRARKTILNRITQILKG